MAKSSKGFSSRQATRTPVAAVRSRRGAETSSDLVSRAGLASAAGTTFGGRRDLFAALGYLRKLAPKDHLDRYKRGGIAKRIVDAMPKATWRGGGVVVDAEDEGTETQFELAWKELDKRLQFWPTFLRADTLMGLGRYSVILIGAPAGEGAVSGAEQASPLPMNLGPKGIVYLAPFGEAQVRIDEGDLVKDTGSERWGLPEFYQLVQVGASTRQAVKVHHTRILHLAEDLVDSDLYGAPRLESVWNYLDDLEKIVGAGAEAFWRRADPGLHLDMDLALRLDQPAEDKLSAEIDEYQHNLRRVIRTRGVKVNPLSAQPSSIEPNVDTVLTLIAATTGIPHRILTGSERGELASSQDRNNWNERVSDRRQAFAEAGVVIPLIERLIEHGALPEPREEDWHVEWPELDNLEDDERAAIADVLSKVNQQFGKTVYVQDEIRAVTGHPPMNEVDPTMVDDGLDANVPAEGDPALEVEDDDADQDADGDEEEARAARRPFRRAKRGTTRRPGRLFIVPRTGTSGGCGRC